MKKLFLSILTTTCLICPVSAQNKIRISLTGGYGEYALSDIKHMQIDATRYFKNLQVMPVESFPDYLFYSADVYYPISKKVSLGLTYDYYMTGGRNSLIDYSGEYCLDMPLYAYAFGISCRSDFYNRGGFHFFTRYKLAFVKSILKLNESICLNGVDPVFHNESATGRNISFEPGIGLSYSINKSIALIGSAGYDVYFGKALFKNNETDADWSGIRLRVGIIYMINMK